MRQGFLGPPEIEKHLTEIRPGRCGGRIQLDGTAEVGESLIDLLEFAEGHAEIAVSDGEVRPKSKDPVKGRDGLRVPAKALQGQTKVAQGFGMVGRQTQRGPAAADSTIQLTEDAIGFGQVGVEPGDVGPQGDGPTDQFDGAGMIPFLMVQHAEKMQGVGVLLLADQDPLIEAGQPSPAVRPDASGWRRSERLAWEKHPWLRGFAEGGRDPRELPAGPFCR